MRWIACLVWKIMHCTVYIRTGMACVIATGLERAVRYES